MEDRYGRTIDYMRVSVTDRCNLNCRYCMPDTILQAPDSRLLTDEELVCICRVAAQEGITRFKITGGEPLVRAGCAKLVGTLKKIPGVRQVTLTTNGVLLQQQLEQLLENGLDAVNVSLDTLCPQRYEFLTGNNELARVLEGIYQAVDAGLPVKLNSVLIKGLNDDEWQSLTELTKTLPVDVRFIEMMPIGAGAAYEPGAYNDGLLQKLRACYPGICSDPRIHGNGPAVYYQIPGALGSIGFISAMHGKFCDNCNRLRLTARGALKPCLCYGDSVDLMPILRGSKGRMAEPPDLRGQEMTIEKKLQAAFQQAVVKKPAMHCFEKAAEVTETGSMFQIGG